MTDGFSGDRIRQELKVTLLKGGDTGHIEAFQQKRGLVFQKIL